MISSENNFHVVISLITAVFILKKKKQKQKMH